MAKTGEIRKANQPLKIDRLPISVHEAILHLRNVEGKTWQEIEDRSAEPVGEGLSGFVEWEKLETPVLELFPQKRIPHSNLHRWYDLRVEQVRRDVLNRSAQAREIAQAFSKSVVEGGDEAVLNAARDTFMSILAEDSSTKGRAAAGKALIVLADVMQGARANDIKERKVAIDEKVLQIKLDDIERKAKALLADVERDGAASQKMTSAQLAERIRETYGLTG